MEQSVQYREIHLKRANDECRIMKIVPYTPHARRLAAIIVIVVIAAPGLFAAYAGSCFGSLIAFDSYLGNTPVDYSSLIPANNTELANLASGYEYYLERDNLPINYTLSCVWNESFSAISEYTVTDDGAIWTGMMLAAAVFQYVVAERDGNATEISNATLLLHRLISGVVLLMAVPNGGIGPQYPGILARSVCPDTWDHAHAPIQGLTNEDGVNVFYGKGNYSSWWWVGYPSLDQYSGIIMGLTTAAALIHDDPWVQERVDAMILQIAGYMRETNWCLMDGDNRTTGQSFQYKYEHPSYWLLSILFMASLVDPATYLPLYHQWAYENGYATDAMLQSDLTFFITDNFYTYNINWDILFAMAVFETDPVLKATYQRLVSQVLYPPVRNLRDAWFNLAYLLVMNSTNSNIQKDISDQLMRFGLERIPGQANSTLMPERGLNSTGSFYSGLIPATWPQTTLSGWLAKNPSYPAAAVNPIVSIFGKSTVFLTQPLTVDHMASNEFLFQESPVIYSTYSPANVQQSGLSYLLPYWMARYAGFISGE
jgi:hypothetical protein